MYIDPSILKKRLPAIDKLASMYSMYRSTDLRNRDVRPLMSVCNRILETDPRAQGHMNVRTAALTGYGWRIVPSDTAFDEAAKEATMRLKTIINKYLNNCMKAPAFGVFVMELLWEYDAISNSNNWRISRIYDSTEVELYSDRVYRLNGDVTISKEELMNTDTSASVFLIDKATMPPILPSIAIHEVMLNDNLQNWANFAKKLMGLALAKWSRGADDSEIDAAKNVVATLQTTNFAATSDEINFDFKEFVSGQGSATYKDIKSELEKDITIAFLGQANTAELPKGSGLAAMQVLNLIRGDILWSDMQRVTELVNDQLLKIDYKYLYGNEDVPYRFEFNIDEEIDREKEVRIMDTALKAGLSLDANEVYNRIGMTKPASVADVITGKASLF